MAIDISDAAGMNLMDLRTKQWHSTILAYLQEQLRLSNEGILALLGRFPQPSWKLAGKVAAFWCRRFGFSPECDVCHWSGDNPCTVVALGLLEPGDVAISLGTSDTCLCVLPTPVALPFGHIFPHPVLKDKYFAMLCYTNGDVCRRYVRDTYASGSWDTFTSYLESARNECVGLYAPLPEITPPYQLSSPFILFPAGSSMDCAQHCRAVIEQRALAIKSHLRRLELVPTKITLTGGASVNNALCQVFADVFDAPVRKFEVADSAALGAAMRALDSSLPGEHLKSATEHLKSAGEQLEPRGVDYAPLEALYLEAETRVVQ